MPATDANTNQSKRARFAPKELLTTRDHPGSPTAMGLAAVRSAVVSLPPSMSAVASELGSKLVKLENRLHSCKQKIDRLSTTGFIIKSARFNFKLTARKEISELSDFQALSNEATQAVETCSKALTQLSVRTAKLELAKKP